VDNGTLFLSGAGLDSPHYIVKIFSPTWTTVYNCSDICGNPIQINNLNESGDYHIEISTFDQGWNKICYTLRPIQINPTSRTINPQAPNIQLYPNPVFDQLNISIEELNDNASLLVSNSLGQVVQVIAVAANPTQTLSVDISSLKQGVYTVSLKMEVGKIQSIPFVKVLD